MHAPRCGVADCGRFYHQQCLPEVDKEDVEKEQFIWCVMPPTRVACLFRCCLALSL